ncbi:hypothetical protein [Ruminococcus sp.]|uniref:hypothetical protein n=1 Tax=Ruminococcus sp. TaxID=41978 RepID=UPI0025D7911C|nr:hypothetical protein [Ruminococcus sp.]MBR1431367.1 hypothetical protein [Ruminococcus sp.]
MKKDTDKLFGNISDEEAERIAADYPTGDKEQRDRIFNEIERRVEGRQTSEDIDVSGVETYRPRIYMKVISAAAALVLVAGAAVGGSYLLRGRDKNLTVEPSSEVIEETTETTAAPATEEQTTEPEVPTEEQLLELLNSRSYDDYPQLNIGYNIVSNATSTIEHGLAKRDMVTGNESMIKKWNHSADYYKNVDTETLADWGIDLDNVEDIYTSNEMFMYKDLYICVYGDSDENVTDQYEVTDLKDSVFANPNVFSSPCNFYPEVILEQINTGKYEIQEISGGATFLGRDCTSAHLYCPSVKEYDKKMGRNLMSIDDGDYVDEIQLDILVDNETGFILWFKDTQGDCTEEYSVDTLLFNEDAELPEDGAYIKERLSGCIPNCEETAAYDLSILDETPDSENIG